MCSLPPYILVCQVRVHKTRTMFILVILRINSKLRKCSVAFEEMNGKETVRNVLDQNFVDVITIPGMHTLNMSSCLFRYVGNNMSALLYRLAWHLLAFQLERYINQVKIRLFMSLFVVLLYINLSVLNWNKILPLQITTATMLLPKNGIEIVAAQNYIKFHCS